MIGRVVLCVALAMGGAVAQTQKVDGTPLWRAKLALEMARARVLEDRFADASASLRDASKALADYEKDSPGPHAETARFIRQEIDAYAPRIVRNHEDALDRIDLWRQPVDQWYGDVHKSAGQ